MVAECLFRDALVREGWGEYDPTVVCLPTQSSPVKKGGESVTPPGPKLLRKLYRFVIFEQGLSPRCRE